MADISLASALVIGLGYTKAAPSLNGIDTSRGWLPVIREPFTGAWQRNLEVTVDTALSNPTLFRCVSLIASDIAKMRIRLVSKDADGVWSEVENTAHSPVLRKPNRYQNRIQFYTSWMQSKLTFGNAYILKVRDNRGVVQSLYVLDPTRVTPLVAQEGSVFYQVSQDNLSGVPSGLDAIPASEIIHDRWNTLFHPLCGLSPIYACGLAALQGREIQRHGTSFFQNGARPGGIITAPGTIKDEHAQRLKTYWEDNFSGVNAGKVAVLGDGLSYEALAFNAHDSQLIEQLKLTAEVICGSFGVPSYKVGVGQAPTYNNVEALAQQYYSDALQIHIESIELCLDEGLELPKPLGTEFDLDDLLRMDSASLVKTLTEGVTGGVFKPDEARKRANLGKVMGGDAVYLQQQNFSLEALAKRDAKEDPFAKGGEAAPAATAPAEAPPSDNDNELTSLEFDDLLEKGALGHATR